MAGYRELQLRFEANCEAVPAILCFQAGLYTHDVVAIVHHVQ